MKVTFFNRRPARGNFSMERVFDVVRKYLPDDLKWEIFTPRYVSRGIFKRLYIIFEVAFHQGDINHITGDVHFLSFFMRKKKTILTIHDCGFCHQEMSKISRLIIRFFWYQIPAKRVAYITTISKFSRKEILSIIRFDPKKIIVIADPLPQGFKYFPKKFNSKEPIILQIGTTGNKNLFNLFAALQGVKCRLHIVGHLNKEHLESLEKHQIKFTNFINLSDAQMIKKYKDCDLVSFASTYEGFGMPIIEANATGRPVLTSNIAPMSDVAGKSAYLVDPSDIPSIKKGLLKIINDDGYRKKLIKLGLINARRFDPNVIANQYFKLYKKVAKQNGYLTN